MVPRPVLRPVLRPGAPVLRRDATHLQVGTSPGVVLRDRPGLLGLLRLLDASRDVDALVRLAGEQVPELADARDTIGRLVSVGAVVDAALPRRPRLPVVVQEDRPDSAAGRAVRTVLDDVDLLPDPTVDGLAVVVAHGEPPRTLFERVTLQRVAHLPVVLDESRVRLGPLVLPGRTPCLGCLDQARGRWDPTWPAVVSQLDRPLVRASWSPDPALLWTAAALVGAEVRDLALGRRPRTIGATLTLGPGPEEPRLDVVPWQHGCGCALLATG